MAATAFAKDRLAAMTVGFLSWSLQIPAITPKQGNVQEMLSFNIIFTQDEKEKQKNERKEGRVGGKNTERLRRKGRMKETNAEIEATFTHTEAVGTHISTHIYACSNSQTINIMI